MHRKKIIFLFYKDREAIQKLEGRVRSERTTCGETVSLAISGVARARSLVGHKYGKWSLSLTAPLNLNL